MTKAEFKIWAMALKTYFPRWELLPNAAAMDLWYWELHDLDAEVATAALRKWVNTEKFPPAVSEIRKLAKEIQGGPVPSWGDGWQEVSRAISRYGYMRETEALESMSPVTQEAVRRIGWRDLCFSENPEAIRAQFRQVYETCAKREEEDRNLPPSLKAMIYNIGQLPGKEETCQVQLTTGNGVTEATPET